jgi:hypothetical protein
MDNRPVVAWPSTAFWAMYLGLVALTWVVNYPGRLTPDSLDMLVQAEYSFLRNDWHSVFLVWLWSLSTPVFGQPAGALFIQSCLLFVYPALILARLVNARAHLTRRFMVAIPWLIFICGLIGLAGNVGKDLFLAGASLSGLAIIDLSQTPKCRKISAVAGIVTLMASFMLVRSPNFVILAFVGAMWALYKFGISRRCGVWLFAILSGFAVSGLAMTVVNRTLFGAAPSKVQQSLIIFDIAGISTELKKDLFYEIPNWAAYRQERPWECYIPGGFDGARSNTCASFRDFSQGDQLQLWSADQIPRPWACYRPNAWDVFGWGNCRQYSTLFEDSIQSLGLARMLSWWAATVVSQPYAYVKHRFRYATRLFFTSNTVGGDALTYAENMPGDFDGIRGRGAMTYGVDMSEKLTLWYPTAGYAPFGFIARVLFSHRAINAAAFLVCALMLASVFKRRRAQRLSTEIIALSSALGTGNGLMLSVFGVADVGSYLLLTIVCAATALVTFATATADVQEKRSSHSDMAHNP